MPGSQVPPERRAGHGAAAQLPGRRPQGHRHHHRHHHHQLWCCHPALKMIDSKLDQDVEAKDGVAATSTHVEIIAVAFIAFYRINTIYIYYFGENLISPILGGITLPN